MEVALAGNRSICRRGFEALPGQINKEVDLRPEATDEAFFGRPAKQKASRCKSRFLAIATGINQHFLDFQLFALSYFISSLGQRNNGAFLEIKRAGRRILIRCAEPDLCSLFAEGV